MHFQKTKTYRSVAILFLCLATTVSFAGEPLLVASDGTPYRWDTSTAVPFHHDGGGLGMLNNAAAVSLVEAAFQQWSGIATAAIGVADAGQITDTDGAPLDVDATNFAAVFNKTAPTGQNQIVFDANGEIFDLLFGPDSGVLGFSGPDVVTTIAPFQITEGSAFLNGAYIDGNPANGEVSLGEFKAVAVHEFGHFLNLAHAQVNGNAILKKEDVHGFGVPPLSSIETMYPLAIPGDSSAITPHADDIAIFSILYPAATAADPDLIANTGTLTGKVFLPDGLTAANGANVIARNISGGAATVFTDAVSQISGAFALFPGGGGSDDTDLQGRFTLYGLSPGSEYAIEIDAIGEGAFSSETLNPLPGPEEFFNGGNESADPSVDHKREIVAIVPEANLVSDGVDIIINQELTLRKYDGSVESVRSVSAVNGPNDYFAVRHAVPASVAAPYTISAVRFFNNDGATVWPQIILANANASGQPDLSNPLAAFQNVTGSTSAFIEVDANVTVSTRADIFVVIKLPPGQSLTGTGAGGGPGLGADGDLALGVINGNFFSTDGVEFQELQDANLAIELDLFGPQRPDDAEPNDITQTATPLAIGTTTAAYVDPGGDVDVYAVSASQNAFLRVDLAAARLGSLLDGFLSLHDSNGVLIAENDDRAPGVNKDPLLEAVLPVAGTFFLTVKHFEDGVGGGLAGGQAYFYELQVDTLATGSRFTHATGSVSFTLWSNGVYGDDGGGTGGGFSFLSQAPQTLFAGGFMAVTPNAMAVNVPSVGLTGGETLVDFNEVVPFSSSGANVNFDNIISVLFDEGGSNHLNAVLGLSVRQTSFSRGGDDFVLLKCAVRNNSITSIQNLYLGQFADWDVGAGQQAEDQNRGGYDNGRSLVYQFANGVAPGDPNWYGVQALQPASGARVTEDLDPAAFFSYLSDFNGPGPQPVSVDADYASFVGAGPFTLAPGDSAVVGFAWLAGQELAGLLANADAAQTVWDDLVVTVEQPESVQLPAEFALEQNYPNPFNPSTQIRYTLPRRAVVHLVIYNLLGQPVRNLVPHEKQSAGRYSVLWDGRDDSGKPVASGIYLSRITAGDFVASMKMTLLK